MLTIFISGTDGQRARQKVMAAYRQVYGFGHLRADCRGPHACFEYGTSLPYLTYGLACSTDAGWHSGVVVRVLDLPTPSSPGGFQPCLSLLNAPGYLGEGCQVSPQLSDASTPSFSIPVLQSTNV